MGALLGPLGGLEEIKCATSLSVAPVAETMLSVLRALDGTEYGQLGKVRRNREWSVEVGTARPEQIERLYQLFHFQQVQSRPFVFFPEDAQVENMLDPNAANLDPARWVGLTTGGARALPLEHGTTRFLSSGMTPTNGDWAELAGFPVPYQRTVTVAATVSAYAGRTAEFVVVENGMDGQPILEHPMSTTEDGVLERLSTTFETAKNTATLTLKIRHANTIATPQVTLTDRPVEWAAGAGCVNAVISSGPSKDVQLAFDIAHDWGRRSGHGWTIREMGNPNWGHHR